MEGEEGLPADQRADKRVDDSVDDPTDNREEGSEPELGMSLDQNKDA